MGFQYLTNIPLTEALEEYISVLKYNGMKPKDEIIPVDEALHRISFCAVYAKICAPHYNACAMDGIAIHSSITFGATETTPVSLTKNDYVRVDTGDPLPMNCDAVVMIEDVVEDGELIRLYSAATPWQHVRQIGEDISAGDMIIPSYTKITPAIMGSMLASGVMSIQVIKRPVVGIIPTGDEIVMPTANPKPGDIIEFNSTIFSNMLKEEGCVTKTYPIVPDKFNLIVEAVQNAVRECDVVILNAGSSAGREDFSSQAIKMVGEVLIHGIAIKPGKPAILGLSGCVPILGVPGYPVSGIIVINEILNPIIRVLYGNDITKSSMEKAFLSKRLNSSLKYREFVRTRLGMVNGKLVAVPLNRGSGVVSSFMKADGIIDVPQDLEGYEAGEEVNVKLLRELDEIKNLLVITGSHDPLLDEATDIMKQICRDSGVASTHVGSMGGIMALKRKETHLAGIHLLDGESNSYNISYVKRYFPNGGVVLVECVKRIQGLMVYTNNPLNIQSIKDIKENKLSYVNRQKGSGTRILFDHLLKQENILQNEIDGYAREESTHTNVAAVIAAKSADVGMGIYSAAKMYDLDFIPICEEEYDLLVSEETFHKPTFLRFLEVLKSDEFRIRLESMGGYTINNPGNIISL